MRWIGGALVTFAALVLAFVSAIGPPWQTTLEVEPSPPDKSDALSLPFVVKNRSALFDDKDARLSCGMLKVTSDNGNLENLMSIKFNNTATIPAGETRPFRCSFPLRPAAPIKEATLYINATYRLRLFGVQNVGLGPFKYDSTTKPPRWLRQPLK